MNKYVKSFKDFNLNENLKSTRLIEREYDFFHISSNMLGDYFTFTPRIPNMPFRDENNNIIEDNFTKRISLSKTIKNCLDAITDEEVDGYYIYGIKKLEMNLKYLLDLSSIKFPDGYDVDFNLNDWLSNNGIANKYNSPAQLPENIRILFYGCVPDCNITSEYWYLDKLKMEYIGEVIPWKYGFEKILA